MSIVTSKKNKKSLIFNEIRVKLSSDRRKNVTLEKRKRMGELNV